MDKRIYLCLAHMGGQEMDYIQQAFDTNWVVSLGPNVDGFEEDLKSYFGQGRDVVALASGTAAVHLALIACGVGPGDEVLVQSFTFCAAANPVLYLGAAPVFVDSEKDSWNMDPDLLEEAILDRIRQTGKTPKVIIPVALYGMPYQVDRILAIAGRYGIPVIEDAAEGLGSRFDGQLIGSFGRFGVLSFNGNKMITTSGGGALVCPDMEAKRRVMFYATQAREDRPYYLHEEIGYNYRMSNVCAGIGRGQMTVARGHIAHHRRLASLYEAAFSGHPAVRFHGEPEDYMRSNFWLSTVTFEGGRGGSSVMEPLPVVTEVMSALAAEGIESRPLWRPMHTQPVYRDAPAYVNGTCERLFRKGLCLPSGPCVDESDAHRVVDTILKVVEGVV